MQADSETARSGADTPKELSVFIASPSDVQEERERAKEVIARLGGTLVDDVPIRAIAWEEDAYFAEPYQRQILDPLRSDLVIGIVWARAGTPLGDGFRRADGTAYESGTIYEIERSLESFRVRSHPKVALFPKSGDPPMPYDRHVVTDMIAQRETLGAALKRWTHDETVEITAAENAFATVAEFEEKLEKVLKKWLDENPRGAIRPVWRIDRLGSPFPGLVPYDDIHSPVFFGRDAAIRVSDQKLREAEQRGCAFLLIVGASGAGKSSLARAGLVPRHAKPGVVAGINRWRCATMLPGGAPLSALAEALRAVVPQLHADDTSASPELARKFRENPVEIAAMIARVTPRDERILLLVDQFEEALAADVASFAEALRTLALCGCVSVIATLRADRYGDLLAVETLLDLKNRGAQYDLTAPGSAEFAEIVRSPAQVASLSFERRPSDGKDLADLLLEALGKADALPLLQVTLEQLYEQRQKESGMLTFEAYERIGGLEGAISLHADTVVASLDADARTELQALILDLTRTGTSDEYEARPVSRAAFETTPARRKLVSALERGRLVLGGDHGELRVAHEALLRNWHTAADILAEHSLVLHVRDRLEPLARDWSSAGRTSDDLLPWGPLLSRALNVLPALRAAGDAQTIISFIEASVEKRRAEQESVRTQLARDEQKTASYLGDSNFGEAESELRRIVEYLSRESDPALAEKLKESDAKRTRVANLHVFYQGAQRAWSLAGEEDFEEAPRVCEEALGALGALEEAGWWKRLQTQDLESWQIEGLKQETYRTLLLHAALQLVPGIFEIFPRSDASVPEKSSPAFDATKLAGLVPGFALRQIVGWGGVGPLKLPALNRVDRPKALEHFQKSRRALDDVREFEEALAVERGEPYRQSRTSYMTGQIGGLLAEFASGPAGVPLDYKPWLVGDADGTRPEPVNAADYFFVGLFNYFIAKRREAIVPKLIDLMRGRFPDLDARSPLATAERLLRSAVALEPKNYWPHWLLGRTLLEAGNPDAAELAFNAAVALRPDYARGYEQRALALGKQWAKANDDQLRRRAESDSVEALRVAQGDPSVFLPRGDLLALFGETNDAIDAYCRWLELERDLLVKLSRGTDVIRLERFANDALRRAKGGESKQRLLRANAQALLALVYWTRSSRDRALQAKALEHANASLEIDPQNGHALALKGVFLVEHGEPNEAIGFLERALNRDSLNYLAALSRARAQEQIRADRDALLLWQDLEDRSATSEQHRCPPWMLQEARAARVRIQALSAS